MTDDQDTTKSAQDAIRVAEIDAKLKELNEKIAAFDAAVAKNQVPKRFKVTIKSTLSEKELLNHPETLIYYDVASVDELQFLTCGRVCRINFKDGTVRVIPRVLNWTQEETSTLHEPYDSRRSRADRKQSSNTTMSTPLTEDDFEDEHVAHYNIKCRCKEYAALRVSNKDNENNGRKFLTCPGQACNRFAWVSDVIDNQFAWPPYKAPEKSANNKRQKY